MAQRLQIRRDTTSNWTTVNPVLASGEPGFDTVLRKQKTGDGVTAWNSLAFDDATKQDVLVSGTNIKTVNSTPLLGSGDIAVQPTLVSGTNIKTVNGTTLLGSGDIPISGGSWVIAEAFSPELTLTDNTKLPDTTVTGAISFTISGTPSVFKETYVRLTANGSNTPTFTGFSQWPGSPDYDTANGAINQISFFNDGTTSYYCVTPNTLTAFDPDTKQDVLVSAANIKTVNSTSILGSGDVSVQPTLVSGANIKTINSASILGSGDLVVSGSGVNPAVTLQIMDDFIMPTGGPSPMGLVAAGQNGGATASVDVFGLFGVGQYSCGTTAALGAYGRFLGGSINLGIPASKTIVFRYRVNATFDGTNTGTAYHGFCESQAGQAPRDGAYVKQINGGNLFAGTMNDFTETQTDLGFVPVINQWYVIKIVVNSAGTQALFYVDNSLVATHTTNIPVTSGRDTAIAFYVAKTAAHTTSAQEQIDFAYLEIVYDAARWT